MRIFKTSKVNDLPDKIHDSIFRRLDICENKFKDSEAVCTSKDLIIVWPRDWSEDRINEVQDKIFLYNNKNNT